MDLMHVLYFLGFAILILIEIITYPKVKKWKPKYKTISVMIAGIALAVTFLHPQHKRRNK